MATSCKDAIRIFGESEARNPKNTPPEECEQVKLYFMKPPISVMSPVDLGSLRSCVHLSMSTNCIQKMCNLGVMEQLQVLSLGRNNLKKIEHLDAIGDRLEQLWLSYNPIGSLSGLEKCVCLHTLYMAHNKISDWKEVSKLTMLPKLEDLVLYGNPIHQKIISDGDLHWPIKMLALIPGLKKLDGYSTIEWKLKISEGNEKELRVLFDRIDADKSGDIDIPELKEALKDAEIRRMLGVTSGTVEEIFAQMDDGIQCPVGQESITWEEFQKWFSTKTDLSTLL